MNCTDAPGIVVREQGHSRYRIICACDWSTPVANDLRSARQAHATHIADRTLNDELVAHATGKAGR